MMSAFVYVVPGTSSAASGFEADSLIFDAVAIGADMVMTLENVPLPQGWSPSTVRLRRTPEKRTTEGGRPYTRTGITLYFSIL